VALIRVAIDLLHILSHAAEVFVMETAQLTVAVPARKAEGEEAESFPLLTLRSLSIQTR